MPVEHISVAVRVSRAPKIRQLLHRDFPRFWLDSSGSGTGSGLEEDVRQIIRSTPSLRIVRIGNLHREHSIGQDHQFIPLHVLCIYEAIAYAGIDS